LKIKQFENLIVLYFNNVVVRILNLDEDFEKFMLLLPTTVNYQRTTCPIHFFNLKFGLILPTE